MKAIRFQHYGAVDNLQLLEQDIPRPADDEVLIRVKAASVNPLDWRKLYAKPFLVRFSEGIFKPKDGRLGADVAGRVEAVGQNVQDFKVGDAVFAESSAGSFAEYTCCKASQLALKPATVSFEAAAAAPVAALTALQGLRDHAQLKAGEHILINGALGGIGSYATQIAKAYGAQVSGVVSTAKLEPLKALGADHVIDYTQRDVRQLETPFDVIFDTVGNLNAASYKRLLKPEGRAVVAGFKSLSHMLIQVMLLGGLSSRISKQRITSMLAKVSQNDLETLAEMLEQGTIRSVIERCYPLAETAEAIKHVAAGHVSGKVVIQVA